MKPFSKEDNHMLYKEDWEKSRERLNAYWEKEVVDRCCVAVCAVKDGSSYKEEAPPDSGKDLYEYYTNKEWILDRNLKRFENTYFGGDAFPNIFAFLGTGGHAKYFKGAKFHCAKDTIWYDHIINDPEKDRLVFDAESDIFKLEKENFRFFAEKGKDKFFISMPDNCGVLDAYASLRGTDSLLTDLLDRPEKVKASLAMIQDVLKKTNDELFDIIKENNEGGSTHGWMYMWSKGRHLQIQADFSVMISPGMFEGFVLPELEETAGWLDRSTYHLDGQEQIRHLDMILSVKKLDNIQWTPVAGQPRTSEFMPVLSKIQKAGKGLILIPEKNEIEKLMTELSSKGLMLITSDVESETEAREIVKKVEKLTKMKAGR